MPVDISIKQVDDKLAERLRARAKRNHRSLQGELKAILEEAAGGARLTVQEIVERDRATGFSTPSQAVELVREGREERTAQIERVLEKEPRSEQKITVRELYDWVRREGFNSPDEATAMIREDRDDPTR